MSSVPYPNPQAIFYQQYEAVRRDEVVGILLALFLGGFGIHHFYLRRTGLGILYCCFCWTPLPGIAAALGITMPGWGQPVNVTVNLSPADAPTGLQTALTACPRCQQTNAAGSRFCFACGNAL